MACDVMGSSEEPTVVLLNDHIAKLPSKYLCLHVFTVFFFCYQPQSQKLPLSVDGGQRRNSKLGKSSV